MTIDEIVDLFRERGHSLYGGERVTQLEHALQAAHMAERDDCSDELIAAALLHDVGHLLHVLPDDAPDNGIDDQHEATGGDFLGELFPPAVTEPVRLHVPAKRYLCAVDDDYFETLSKPSVVSLELQGGKMTSEEVAAFRSLEFFEDAIRLRRYDDEAKVVDAQTPDIDHFASYLYRVGLTTQARSTHGEEREATDD